MNRDAAIWHTCPVTDDVERLGDPASVLSDLHDAVDSVAAAFEGLEDWGPSEGPTGQYASDIVADRVVHGILDPLGYGVLSEESGFTAPTVDGAPVIVVDPLDGSTNASRGLPWFATSLCAVDADGPMVSVVADLVGGVRYDAVRGWGARRDGEPIARTSAPPLNKACPGCHPTTWGGASPGLWEQRPSTCVPWPTAAWTATWTAR